MNQLDSPSPALTPGKLGLIAVLGIVLVIVLVMQFSSGDSDNVAIKRRVPRPSTEGNAANAGQSSILPSNPTPSVVRLHWPEIHRDEVIDFDPFEVPASLQPKPAGITQTSQIAQSATSSPPEAMGANDAQRTPNTHVDQAQLRAKERKSRIERIRVTTSELQKQGVGVVVMTSTGAVARVGEQELRVGDVINGVLRIVDIDHSGIVIQETPFEAAPEGDESPRTTGAELERSSLN